MNINNNVSFGTRIETELLDAIKNYSKEKEKKQEQGLTKDEFVKIKLLQEDSNHHAVVNLKEKNGQLELELKSDKFLKGKHSLGKFKDIKSLIEGLTKLNTQKLRELVFSKVQQSHEKELAEKYKNDYDHFSSTHMLYTRID